MSGEGAETRTRQGAGLGDLAAASGLGINGESTDEEQGNQFLSAARRAARAAVLEASQFDPAVTANARPVRKTTKRRNRRTLLLAIILMGLLAFAGYKYWRGELDFKGISIGGFSLTQFGPATAGDALPVASAEMSQPAADGIAEKTAANAEGDALPVSAMAAKNETVELKPISPSGTIAFGAPDSSSKPLQSGTRTADTAGNMIAGLITAAGEHLFAAGPGKAQEPDDSFGSTASVPDPLPKTDRIIAKAGEEPASDTAQKFAVALREAATRTASLPDAGSVGTNLPTSIGSAGLRQAAQAGIPEAQFEIASRFADGSGVKPDIAAAAVWYEKAAAKGLAPAQFRLGSLYEKGNGRPLNRDRAAELYLAASEAGNAKAMHNLAVLYAEGGTGTADLEKAAIWFRKAAEHGVHDSQFNVGILYARGLGVEKDFAQAYKWFAIAAKTGDEQASKRRDTIAASMNQDNLAKALAAANIFQPIPLKPEANLVIEPRGGWATAALDDSPSGAELVRRIQTLLMERGFDPGPADGVMGRRTVGAIEAFQVEAGIAVSGRPDLAVLSALESGEI